MASPPTRGLSLCSGGGGLDMGLALAEPGFATTCYVEWEAYPRATLVAAQRAGYAHTAPIWDDVTTFDARPWRGVVDTLLAGYPCQPFSAAGQRLGEDDERHLWPHVARIIGELGDGLEWVFLENVPGHISLGLETVLRDLWDLGFTPAVGVFSAREVGASHERQRIFVVAHADGRNSVAERKQRSGQQRFQSQSPGNGGSPVENSERARAGSGTPTAGKRRRNALDGRRTSIRSGDRSTCADGPTADGQSMDDSTSVGCGERESQSIVRSGRDTIAGTSSGLANAESDLGRSQQQEGGTGSRRARPTGNGADLADASGARPQGRELGGSSEKWDGSAAPRSIAERGRPCLFPPGPGDSTIWASIITMAPDVAPSVAFGDVVRRAGHLSQMAAAGELEETEAESSLRRMVDGLASWTLSLRLLGNGVCPLAAAHAWRSLSFAHGLWPVDLETAGTTSRDAPDGNVLNGPA